MTGNDKKREPPQWLNIDYLTKALQEGLRLPSLQINSCHIKPATAVGDNYASLMFRAQLEIIKSPPQEPEKFSIVIKTLPPGNLTQELMQKSQTMSVFEKEATIFQKVLPLINKMLRDVLPDHQPLSAECIWFGKEPEEVLILQDLKESGFDLLDRMDGLDLQSTNFVLTALAKLHAGSLALIEKKPNILEGLTDNLWLDTTSDMLPKMINCGLSSLIEEASEWNDFSEVHLQKLKDLKATIIEKLHDALKYDEDSLNVLQHGDCWINNVMFRQQNGHVKSIRLVDFQISCLNSAAQDLNYFIFTSPNSSIRLNKIDEMLQTYFTTFMDTIDKLGVNLKKKFTMEELRKEFKRRAFFGFIATLVVYPITVTKSQDVIEIEEFFDDGKSKRSMYHNEIFKKMFKLTLPYFLECGVL